MFVPAEGLIRDRETATSVQSRPNINAVVVMIND